MSIAKLDITRAGRQRWLDELLQPYDLNRLHHEVHLLKGHPDVVIPQLVETQRIELIVLGTVSRTGVAGLIMGTSAENVLQQVNCSVLAVKPDGFVTPVYEAEG